MHAIAGAITIDTIYRPNKMPFQDLGGILYSTFTAAALSMTPVIPISNVGGDVYDRVISRLKCIPTVETVSLRKLEERNIHCHILALGEYGVQYDEGCFAPLRLEQLAIWKNADCISINYVAGNDVPLAIMRSFRQMFSGLLHLDVHCLIMARASTGERYIRRPHCWHDYLTVCDIAQANEFEAKVLLGKSIANKEMAIEAARQLLQTGPRLAAVVTCGAKGAAVSWRSGKRTIGKFEACCDVKGSDLKIGCGDAFGAAFCYGLLQGLAPDIACSAAARVASVVACCQGINSFPHSSIKNAFQQNAKH